LELIRQVVRLQQTSKACVRILGVADSIHLLLSKSDFLDLGALESIVTAKGDGKSMESIQGTICQPLAQGTEALLRGAPSGARYILADCTASEETGRVLADGLAAGWMVVLANKKPITGSMSLYKQLTADMTRFRCESTCGAGMPIMAAVRRVVRSGDPVSKMAGALSGTLGYVMSGLEEGKSLSAVVIEAKAKGFTEPDPRDDLSGLDVARKALILARSLGWDLEISDVQVESLFPAALAPDAMSVDDFMASGIQTLDQTFKEKVHAASSKGEVLRYAAQVEDGKCSVGLLSVDKNSPLGRLSGTDNLFYLQSDCYSPNPLVIQGRGAGTAATASGVLADILELMDCNSLS